MGNLIKRTISSLVKSKQKSPVVKPTATGIVVEFPTKSIIINGEIHKVDPRQLMRLIKNVTQTIGEYKRQDNVFAAVVMGALRKARNDLVSQLESKFKISWQVDEDGQSKFYQISKE